MKKRLTFLLSFLLLTVNLVFASDPAMRFWVLQDFSKGLNSHISNNITPDNQCVEAKNVRFNSRYGALGKRETLITAWDTGSTSNNGLHRFYESDGTIKTIIATSTYLDIGDADATTTTHIAQGLTDGKRCQFITFKDVAISTNGSDQPLKYDGLTTTTTNTDNARTASDLCAELGAPFAQLSSENGGNDLDASSWYMYKMVWYDGTTYSYSTARSNPIVTGSTVQNITLTGVPIGPVGTTHRYIYRTLGAANRATVLADTVYYLVKDLANNTTVTFDDAVADGTADDDTAPTWATASAGINVTPPKGKFIEINNERVWIAGSLTYPSDLYFSDDGNPDYFDPDDYDVIRNDDGDEITFIKTFLGILRVGKTNTIQSFYTDGSTTTDWYASDPFSFIGCPAPYSATVSPVGIIYLGRHGLYRFDGQTSTLISDAVTPEINDISQADIEETVGFYHNNEYRLAYTSLSSGLAYNNRVLVYDLVRDAYTIDTENVNCWAAFNSGTDFGTLYSGSSYTDGYVVAHSSTTAILSKRYKSELDAGTFDDSRTIGTEESPEIELAWDCTINGWLTELQTKDASINTINDIGTYLPAATIDRPDTDGTWISPVYRIDAAALDKFYWNEKLGAYGDITWQIRQGATSAACSSAAWTIITALTNPNGSDLSTVTANDYIQLKASFSTTDINYTPTLYFNDGYVFKMNYSKVGSANETSVLSEYKTGWKDFGIPGYMKFIKRIKVFYQGTSGTLNFNIKNDIGDIDKTFSIDLAQTPDYSLTDEYTGESDLKVYTFIAPINSATDPSLISQMFQFTITENGTTAWEIDKIEVAYQVEEYYD